ncbi:hypothetical protein BJ165DRAFT_561946 [Panaeolus papilionaceus]|nr:hypothetical protein BJ165DRAFT_561946 [Panaeolus papilionaceus]
MNTTFKPITNTAIKRAQHADPNMQCCLIENCAKTQAVHIVHVYSRETRMVTVSSTLDVECRILTEILIGGVNGMGLDHGKGTLNLDTRQNIYFLGASMHRLCKDRKWALLPEKDIVHQYYDKNRREPFERNNFPNIEGDTFQYKLLPIDIEDIYVTRETSDPTNGTVTVHNHLFDDLPCITSHIHPTFAIIHLGQLLVDPLTPNKRALFSKIPWLIDVRTLYLTWSARLPGDAEKSTAFHTIPSGNQGSTGSPSVLDGEETCTPLRRIQNLQVQPAQAELSSRNNFTLVPSGNHSIAPSRVNIPPCKRTSRKRSSAEVFDDQETTHKTRILTSNALQRQDERNDLESVKWTSVRLAKWAQKSGTPLPPSPSPSPPPPPPLSSDSPRHRTPTLKPALRRSARIKGRARTRKTQTTRHFLLF